MALPTAILRVKNALGKAKEVKDVKDEITENTEKSSESSIFAFLPPKIRMRLAIGCGFVVVFCLLFVSILIVMVPAFGNIALLIGVDPAYAADGNTSGNTSSSTSYLDWAIEIANDDSHGYSQCSRTGPDYDCSSLVWYSLVEGAGMSADDLGGYAFNTDSMPRILKGAGFTEHTYTGPADLKSGDILLRNGHTEIYVGDDKTVGAHIAETGSKCGEAGDQTGNEISVATNTGSWGTYYRLES